MTTCPVCLAKQDAGLLCSSCCDGLERALGDVAAIVGELDIALSKQARIGAGSGTAGLARERMPISIGAMQAADNLGNVLTTWARDVTGPDAILLRAADSPSIVAMRLLLLHIDHIRRHPAVVELVDEVTDAIVQARRAVDRPADRVYLGVCMVPTPDAEGREVTCLEEIYASPSARFAVCKVCGVTHDVEERRQDLLDRAGHMLFTVQEAAQMVGSYGNLSIGESTIRGYISKGKLGYHGKVAGSSVIRLGDLMSVIGENAAKPTRKLRRAV